MFYLPYNLEEEIEKFRSLMIENARSMGFTHPKTVEISQVLDELIYIQQFSPGSLYS